MYSVKPKAVLFDWDNTLADTWDIIHAALCVTFDEMGHEPWSFEDVKSGREGIHHSLRDSFPRIFGDDWEKARDIYYSAFLDTHLDKIKLMPMAEKVINLLHKSDILIGVVSNKTGKYLREEVKHLGFDHCFSTIIGATDAKKDKPHPDPVHLALEGSNVKAGSDVWFIGDSETDLECALNSGCLPLYFGDNNLHEKYHIDERIKHPLRTIKNHDELLKILENFDLT